MQLPAASKVESFVSQLGITVPEPLEDQKAILAKEPGRSVRKTIALSLISPSKTNPRTRFDAKATRELADSIANTGLLQPLVVRPGAEAGTFELIAGERRFRALKLLERTDADCLVREDMSDADVAEAQCVENVQRENLHPLEEAQAYLNMLNAGWKADTIAQRVGKGRSRAWVYGRMKLLALGPEARTAFLADVLPLSVAVPLASRTHAVQAELLAEFTQNMAEGEVIEARWALSRIKEFDRSLKSPPFNPKDAMLVEGAPACADCPSNSLNQPAELFAEKDTSGHGICSNVTCYNAKATAAFQEKAQALVDKGATLLSEDELKKAMPFGYVNGTTWCRADETCYSDTKHQRTWGQLVKGAPADAAPVAYVARDQSGAVLTLYKRDEAMRAAAANGHAFAKRAAKPSKEEAKKERAKQKSAAEKAGARQRIADEAFALVLEKMTAKGATAADLRAMVDEATEQCGDFDSEARYFKALGLMPALNKADAKGLGALLFAALLYDRCVLGVGELGAYPKALTEAAKRYGVDLKKLEDAQALADKVEAVQKKKVTKTTKKAEG